MKKHYLWLPLGLQDYIEHDLKRSLDTLHQVVVEQRGDNYRFNYTLQGSTPLAFALPMYVLTFIDSTEPEGLAVYHYRPGAFYAPPTFIEGYDDVLPPNGWINRLIMDREQPVPDYSLPSNAQRVAAKLLQDNGKLFLFFAWQLFPAEPADLLATHVKMGLLASTLTPQRICTAAYRARLLLAQDERNLQEIIDQARTRKEPGQ